MKYAFLILTSPSCLCKAAALSTVPDFFSVARVVQNRLLAMNYIYEGEDDKLYNAHRYSFVLEIISLQFETESDAFYNLVQCRLWL